MRAKLFAAVLRVRRKKLRSYQIWYNMRINMSKEKPVGLVAKVPQVGYSAAYPTGRERIAKVTPLPCGLSTMVLLY